MPKEETRRHAQRFDLKVADKPDSQDICFVPSGKYASVVEKLRPGSLEPGEIVHVDGTVLGTHKGTISYTIGQRRGLGVSSTDPLYVVKIDRDAKRVVVGPKESLACNTIKLKEVNWLGENAPLNTPIKMDVKIRSTMDVVGASIVLMKGEGAQVTFDKPEYGVAPGQACVFYQAERVLGGGWIESAEPNW